jgi:DNA-binding transcriptional MerR regulator/uncharacterized cupin superfamily protein
MTSTKRRPGIPGLPKIEKADSLGPVALAIGDFSRVTGVRPSVLRDWELLGIVSPIRIGSHRRYTEKDLQRVIAARKLRSRNYNPSAIAALLGPVDKQPASEDSRLRVGPTLRDARKVAQLTLVEVAQRVGCSTSHLSSVERGGSMPSMSLLHRVAGIYGIDVAAMFGAIVDSGPVKTTPRESAPLVTEGGALKVWGVARTTSICADIYEADPGAGSGGSYSHEGEEYIYILSGECEITLTDYETYVLRTGEALSFASMVSHEWRNISDAPVRMLWTNTHPELAVGSCAAPTPK